MNSFAILLPHTSFVFSISTHEFALADWFSRISCFILFLLWLDTLHIFPFFYPLFSHRILVSSSWSFNRLEQERNSSAPTPEQIPPMSPRTESWVDLTQLIPSLPSSPPLTPSASLSQHSLLRLQHSMGPSCMEARLSASPPLPSQPHKPQASLGAKYVDVCCVYTEREQCGD